MAKAKETEVDQVEHVHTIKLAGARRPRAPVPVVFTGQGKTHAEFKDECDINLIMEKWRRGVPVTHVKRGQPWYGDFSNAGDFQTALDRVNHATSEFEKLPAKVREYCGNNPANFINALDSPEAVSAMIDLGLAVEPEKPAEEPEKPAETAEKVPPVVAEPSPERSSS